MILWNEVYKSVPTSALQHYQDPKDFDRLWQNEEVAPWILESPHSSRHYTYTIRLGIFQEGSE